MKTLSIPNAKLALAPLNVIKDPIFVFDPVKFISGCLSKLTPSMNLHEFTIGITVNVNAKTIIIRARYIDRTAKEIHKFTDT